MLTGLNPEAAGGYRALGTLLYAGDSVEVPDGALILTVDKATRGWEDNYRGNGRHAVSDATVTVHLASGETLSEQWSRQYISAKSAFGAATMKKLTALLGRHPAPAGDVVVLHEAQRPNHKEGRCRWCKLNIYPGLGHVVGHGADAEVEHYEQCASQAAENGEACALCGVTVVSAQARRHIKRDGTGAREVRHTVPDCWDNPVPSFEEQIAARDARDAAARQEAARERAVREKKEAAKARRVADKAAKEQAAHDAEQARVAGLKTVSRTTAALYDKGVGGGVRCCLSEHTDTLEDGTTTKRWTVETYSGGSGFSGEDYDPEPGVREEFTDKKKARSRYQDFRYEPRPRGSYTTGPGGKCWECERGGATVERRDSSGITGVICHRCDRENPDDVTLSFG
jgi:hypothetical protein